MASQTRSVDNTVSSQWINPNNAFSENDLCTSTSGDEDQNVYNVINTPFTIPVGASIDGIEVKVIRGGDVNDYYTIELQDKILAWKLKTGTAYLAVCVDGVQETLGVPTDLWGGSWDPAHINSFSFQIRLTFVSSSKANTMQVDHIEVTVHYTEASTGTLNVDTTPVKGEVFVEAESWGTAPQERDLAPGFYTVSFGDVPGYVTPDPVEAEVTANQTTYVNEVYTEAWYCTLNGTIETTEENCDKRGFDWGIAPDTYTEEWIEEGSYGVGVFSHQITGLDLEETCYFRAKAHNAGGWGYGIEKSVLFEDVSFTNVQVTDKTYWKKISWVSNVTANHRVAYSLNSDMSGSSYSEWDNDTDSPEIYISSENLKPDTIYYYQAETLYLGDTFKDSIRSFATTLTVGVYQTEWVEIDTVVDMLDRGQVELYFHNGIYYLFTAGADGTGEEIGLYTSTNGIRFKFYGNIISSPPAGHDSLKTPTVLVVGSTFILWAGIRWDNGGLNCWREGVWTGDSFTNLTYVGLALDNDEKPTLTRNCRILDAWYDTVSSKYCTYVGGGSSSAGGWDIVYYAESSTIDFRGTLDANELYDINDWASGSWPDVFIYPPKGEWIGDKYLAWVTGCGSSVPPYAFDQDLFFVSEKRTVSKINSYSGDAAAAYASAVLGLTLPSKLGTASDDGDLSTIFTTYNGFDLILFKMAGFWANNAVLIEKGYMPRFHYAVMPTEAEFKAMLDIMIYVWDHDASVNIKQVSGIEPTYAEWDVEGTDGDTIWVNINDFTTDTVKLYRDEEYLKDVSPVSGSDFLFSTTLSGSFNTFTLRSEVGFGFKKLVFTIEPPTGGQFNKLAYDSEPPVPSAWNKLKREV